MAAKKKSTKIVGVVTAIKGGANSADNVYTIITDKAHKVRSELVLGLQNKVEAEPGVFEGTLTATNCEIKSKATGKESATKIEKVAELAYGTMNSEHPGMPKELKAQTPKMEKALNEAAKLLIKKYLSGAPIVVRFHNDCDGSSGALGIHLAIEEMRKKLSIPEMNIHWRMNRSVAYGEESFSEDSFLFGRYASVEKPLVLIVDFGTMQESEAQILSAHGKFDMIMLDHHPVYDGFPKDRMNHCINTWLFGSDSDYTAGFLACVFANQIAKVNGMEDIMMASLIGDFSKYGDREQKHADKLAIVLDYLTSTEGRFGSSMPKLTPKGIASVIDDKEKFESVYKHAIGLLNEAIDRGVRSVKHYKSSKADIYLLDFHSVASDESKYPMPGRYSSRLQERLESLSEKGSVTLVHYGNYISARMSRQLKGKVDLLGAMAEVKATSEHVLSFGGHECAGSLRIEKEHVDKVTKVLLKRLGASV